MRRSNRPSISRKMKKMHESEALLYILIVISILQLLYYVIHHKFKSFLFFCIIGVVLKMFIKSTSVVLILDLLITNILMTSMVKNEGFSRREGAENMSDSTTTDTTQEEKKPAKKVAPAEQSSVTTGTATESGSSTIGEAMTTLRPENVEKQLSMLDATIDRVEGLMVKAHGLMNNFNTKQKK